MYVCVCVIIYVCNCEGPICIWIAQRTLITDQLGHTPE